MKFHYIIYFFFILFSFSVNAQDMAAYTDNWEGKIENSKTFNLKVEIHNLGFEKAVFKIYNNNKILDFPFDSTTANQLKIPFAENSFFEGILSADNTEINGFIKSGLLLYHLKLIKTTHNFFYWRLEYLDD